MCLCVCVIFGTWCTRGSGREVEKERQRDCTAVSSKYYKSEEEECLLSQAISLMDLKTYFAFEALITLLSLRQAQHHLQY